MKILLNCVAKTGLQYHRQIIPHKRLQEVYGTEIGMTEKNMPFDEVKKYNIIHFLRNISIEGKSFEIIDMCKRAGLKIVFDIDDYWRLPSHHPMTSFYNGKKMQSKIIEDLNMCDVITTTTQHLADKIKAHTDKPVYILPNCIDKTDPQWLQNTTESSLVRFGWIGGVYHKKDIEILRPGIAQAYQFLEGFQFALSFGMGGEYLSHEKIFSNNYNLDEDYKKYLRSFSTQGEPSKTQPYRRLLATDVLNYGKLYNDIDVALAPLSPNEFSGCKSELKLIEAGMMGKAVIASRVKPYDSFPEDCVYFVDPKDINAGWFNAIKFFLENKDERDRYAKNLSEYVMKNFNLSGATNKRHEIYKQLLS